MRLCQLELLDRFHVNVDNQQQFASRSLATALDVQRV